MAENLARNPGFEQGVTSPSYWYKDTWQPTGVTVVGQHIWDNSDFHSGSRSGKVVITSLVGHGSLSWRQNISTTKIKAGRKYRLRVWRKNKGTAGMSVLFFDAASKKIAEPEIVLPNSASWIQSEWLEFTAPSGVALIVLAAELYAVGFLSVDDYELYEIKKGTVNVYAVADSKEVEASFMVNQQGPYQTHRRLEELDPGPYTFTGSYKGQPDKQVVALTAGTNPDIIFHFSVMHKLTIVSGPSPIDFTFNTEKQSTPFVRELVGGTYTIVMPKSWMIGLDEYIFEQWENGSRKPTRTVTLGSPQEVTLTATYRLRQIDEAGPINQRQAKDTLQEVFGQGADLSKTNPLPTEDSGVHSNPRKYEKTYGFVSARVASAAVAVQLWAVGLAAINPVAGRTAGRDTTVYTLEIENSTGAAVTAWLEDDAGNHITIDYHIANNDSQIIDFVAGKDYGDMDIYFNASAVAVVAQISGTEE